MDLLNRTVVFNGLIDLASEKMGGKVLSASDDFFAPKENLLKPGRGIFIPGKFTDRGKWMDGWESGRKRTQGYDWCIFKLGAAGVIHGVDIDTNNFIGNHPWYASIEACSIDKSQKKNIDFSNINWTEILRRSELNPGSQNLFSIKNTERWTHLKLNIFPDGGIARFRAYGEVQPDLEKIKKNTLIDLAAVENGGKAAACSDMFFGEMNNLIMPGDAVTMGEGWETKRRRGPGNDWIIIKLAHRGELKKIIVDTKHFKGNFPDACSVDICDAENDFIDALNWYKFEWKEILPKTKLKADKKHSFRKELKKASFGTYVKLNIYPDGGVSRLRLFGTVKK